MPQSGLPRCFGRFHKGRGVFYKKVEVFQRPHIISALKNLRVLSTIFPGREEYLTGLKTPVDPVWSKNGPNRPTLLPYSSRDRQGEILRAPSILINLFISN
jgi:hypothetical protein